VSAHPRVGSRAAQHSSQPHAPGFPSTHNHAVCSAPHTAHGWLQEVDGQLAQGKLDALIRLTQHQVHGMTNLRSWVGGLVGWCLGGNQSAVGNATACAAGSHPDPKHLATGTHARVLSSESHAGHGDGHARVCRWRRARVPGGGGPQPC
jgi:hypothetical protein